MPGRVLPWLGRHAMLILAAGIFIGLIAQDLARLLRPLLPASVAGLMVLAYLRVRVTDLRAELLHPRLLALSAGMLLLCPVIMWWVCNTLSLTPVLTAAMVLGAALPPLFSSPAIALLLGMDGALALALLMVTMLASPFALALVAGGLLEFDLILSPFELMLRLAAFLFVCTLVGMWIRRLLGADRIHRNGTIIDGISVLVMLTFAISIMDGIPAMFVADPAQVIIFTLAAFAMNLGLQIISAIACLGFGRRRALTLGFLSGNRAVGLLLAVLPASADPLLTLFFILGQFPIYVLPAALAPVYRRLLKAP